MAQKSNHKPDREKTPVGVVLPHRRPKGTLFAIGGHEDKERERLILSRVAESNHGGHLVVTTLASDESAAMWEDYKRVFHDLGVKHVSLLELDNRDQAIQDKQIELVRTARTIFFTGGDQLRITSKLGGTHLCQTIHDLYLKGGIIAGTSAGASVLCDNMLVAGESEQSHKIGSALLMAPGLGLISGLIIDQHFAERGRISRLLGAVAHNPRLLGVGIDENTSVEIRQEKEMAVLGPGAVYIVDGHELTHTNISEAENDRTLSLFDVRLHMLSQGDLFDLEVRRPASRPAEEAERPHPQRRTGS